MAFKRSVVRVGLFFLINFLIVKKQKKSDASGRGYEHSSEARATSDFVISVANSLNLVNGDAAERFPKFSLFKDVKEKRSDRKGRPRSWGKTNLLSTSYA